jgi:ribonuclease III
VVALLYRDKLQTIDPKAIDKDAKSQLQEYLQSKKMDLPEYQVVSIEGEAHAQSFTVQCFIKKLKLTTTGVGTSRRVAEQQAAKLAMDEIQS